VEKWDEPTEIVIHVNMLKEGWDVTNLYTIVPLRAANARILIEQSIGRGLRLPYGKRTGDTPIDRLNIVAHDKFQEIIEEANRPDSVIRLTELILDPDEDLKGTISVVSAPDLANAFEETTEQQGLQYQYTPIVQSEIFGNIEEKRIARMALEAIRGNESLPNSKSLSDGTVQTRIIESIRQNLTTEQLELTSVVEEANIARIVAIADSYDAMTSQRAYRQNFDPLSASLEIKNNLGKQFDPEYGKMFCENYRAIIEPLSHQPTAQELMFALD